MFQKIVLFFVLVTHWAALGAFQPSPNDFNSVSAVKNELLKKAEVLKGQGDPDFSIQESLMPYVNRLLELSPQLPISQRIPTLATAWKQVWGPYEYRKNDRSVDPTTDPDNIYQVVFADGYYYNVGRVLDKKTKKQKSITLLRGEFTVQEGSDLKVKFTKLTKIRRLPEDLDYIDLPELSESDTLDDERTSLPSVIVRKFFKGGVLTELYTDDALRIAMGQSESEKGIQGYLYIMERVQ